MIFGWIFLAIGLVVLVVFLSVGLFFRSLREEMATEIGTTWQRISEGAVFAAGLSATLSSFSLSIAFFTQNTVNGPLGETTRDASNPLGETFLGIPFANLSGYFLQFTIFSLGVLIVALVVGTVMNYR